MITLTVLALLITLSVTGFSSLVRRQATLAASEALARSLVRARMESLRRGQNVTVCTTSNADQIGGAACSNAVDWSSGWLVWVDTNADGKLDPGEQLLEAHAGHPGTAISESGAPASFSFRPLGAVSGLAGPSQSFTFGATGAGGPPVSAVVCLYGSGRIEVPTAGGCQ